MTSPSAALPQLYRSTLKQFSKNSIHPRLERSPTIPAHLRLIFDSARASGVTPNSPQAKKFARDVDNMLTFMQAHRIHKELVERYNPTSGMTNDERSRKSAKMVGLDFPVPFEEGVAPTMEGAKAKRLAQEQQQQQQQTQNGESDEGQGQGQGQGSLRTVSVKSMF